MSASTRLDAAALGTHLGRFERRLFRMETLPAYAVESDGDDYNRWVAGDPEPTWERKNRWLAVLRAERAAGKVSARVRILTEELTDYERYSCEWGYALNAKAGEDIRVLRRGEHPVHGFIQQDFWVVDDAQALAMIYGEGGRFEGAEILPDVAPWIAARDTAWADAEPFQQWWARHPELHRQAAGRRGHQR